jgi:hypothetical protein
MDPIGPVAYYPLLDQLPPFNTQAADPFSGFKLLDLFSEVSSSRSFYFLAENKT